MKKIIQTFPNLVLATFVLRLEKLLSDSDSVLDIGCGSNSPLRLIDKDLYMVGTDAHKPSIAESKKKKIHQKYLVMDVLDIDKKFKAKSFDVVIANDLIEHLKKKDGFKLLAKMEKIARRKVIVLTPNGFIEQFDEDNIHQEHLSGWYIRDFKKLGYVVEGMYGLRTLRGEEAELKFRPKIFWGVVSLLSHLFYTRYAPKNSFSLLCIKEHEAA